MTGAVIKLVISYALFSLDVAEGTSGSESVEMFHFQMVITGCCKLVTTAEVQCTLFEIEFLHASRDQGCL